MDATADDWEDYIDDESPNEGEASPFSQAQERASEWGNKMQARASKRNSAKGLAQSAENNAAKGGLSTDAKSNNSSFMSAVRNAREAEGKTGFANNVQGKNLEQVAAGAVPGGKALVEKAKKLGPLGAILIVIMVLVGIFAGTQSLAPFGLVANGLDQFNNLRTSMNKRTTYFNRFMLNRNRNNAITKASIFSTEKFAVSKTMASKLQKNNIFYVNDSKYQARFLVYEDTETGKKYAVAANDNDVGRLPDSVEIEINGEKTEIEINSKMKIDDAMIDSDNFSNSLDRGTRTLKGHIAGWFDEISNNLHARFNSSRNRFRDLSNTADEEEIKTKAKSEKMKDDIDATRKTGDEAEQTEDRCKIFEGCDVDVWKEEDTETKDDGLERNADTNEIGAKLTSKAKAIVSGLQSGTDTACAVMKVYSAINAMIGAIHVANIMNYLTGFLEAIQKTQAGDAGKNELATYMNGLSTKGNTYDSSGETTEDHIIKSDTSSLESTAWNQFYSDGTVVVQNDDKVAEKFNRDYVSKQSILEGIGAVFEAESDPDFSEAHSAFKNGVEAYSACLTAQMATGTAVAAADIVLSFIPGVNVIKQGFKVVNKTILKYVKKLVLGAVVGAIIAALMQTVIPYIANVLAVDLIENMAGEDAAYAINSGFNIYNGGQFQLSSGLPATKEKLMAQYRAQQEVIASEAKYERSERSPFDPTSKYTFIGSIVNSMMSVSNTWSSPLSTMSKTVNMFGSAVRGLLPTASADGEVVFETSLNEDCPSLSQIGVVGDAFCNVYIATDMDTMATDPDIVMKKVDDDDSSNFNWSTVDNAKNNGNPEINENSTLGKWIIACAARESQFGTVDSAVINAKALINTGNSVVDGILEGGVGAIPVVGEAKDIIDAVNEKGMLDWASGENCVKEEYAYYSRYSEDQRMMEAAGIIEESQVARFLDKYYEANPLDNSTEGIIARFSGLSKDEVEDTLAVVGYFQWLAQYDPTTYGPEKYEASIDNNLQFESDEVVSSEDIILNKYVVYDDLRTKIKIT